MQHSLPVPKRNNSFNQGKLSRKVVKESAGHIKYASEEDCLEPRKLDNTSPHPNPDLIGISAHC
eukprot:2879676-Amphidinium_carterae.1